MKLSTEKEIKKFKFTNRNLQIQIPPFNRNFISLTEPKARIITPSIDIISRSFPSPHRRIQSSNNNFMEKSHELVKLLLNKHNVFKLPENIFRKIEPSKNKIVNTAKRCSTAKAAHRKSESVSILEQNKKFVLGNKFAHRPNMTLNDINFTTNTIHSPYNENKSNQNEEKQCKKLKFVLSMVDKKVTFEGEDYLKHNPQIMKNYRFKMNEYDDVYLPNLLFCSELDKVKKLLNELRKNKNKSTKILNDLQKLQKLNDRFIEQDLKKIKI
jgi:hypothetical protein